MLMISLPLTISVALLFTQLTHPLSMGLALLLQTILICSCSGMMLPSFWFSYILFLIFLGGMLVLFIYITSLASNEPLNFSITYSTLLFTLIPLTTLMFMLSHPLITSTNQSNLTNIYLFNSLDFTNTLTSSIYNQSTMMFTTFIVIYLLLTLFAVVKITSMFFGPLRLS